VSPPPLNVTVMVAPALRAVMEGRRQIQLGVPASADVGDVLETLLKLYPKLLQHVESDQKVVEASVSVFLGEQALADLAMRRSGLKEGTRLYLTAVMSRARPPPL
jgi:hypothetical protein